MQQEGRQRILTIGNARLLDRRDFIGPTNADARCTAAAQELLQLNDEAGLTKSGGARDQRCFEIGRITVSERHARSQVDRQSFYAVVAAARRHYEICTAESELA